MNIKQMISLSALVALTGASCWGNPALFRAIMKDNVEDVKNALRKGANINSKNEQGETPLTLAITYKLTPEDLHLEFRREIINELLRNKNININETDPDGETPLALAEQEKYNTSNKKLQNFYQEIITKLINAQNNLNLNTGAE